MNLVNNYYDMITLGLFVGAIASLVYHGILEIETIIRGK